MPSLLGTHPPGLIEAVLDDVRVGLTIVDKSGNVVLANRAARRFFGEEHNPVGVSFTAFRRAYRVQDSQGRDIPTAKCALTRALAGEPVEPQDLRVIHPDGRSKWAHTGAHEFSVLGQTGVLLLICDETEQVEQGPIGVAAV